MKINIVCVIISIKHITQNVGLTRNFPELPLELVECVKVDKKVERNLTFPPKTHSMASHRNGQSYLFLAWRNLSDSSNCSLFYAVSTLSLLQHYDLSGVASQDDHEFIEYVFPVN